MKYHERTELTDVYGLCFGYRELRYHERTKLTDVYGLCFGYRELRYHERTDVSVLWVNKCWVTRLTTKDETVKTTL